MFAFSIPIFLALLQLLFSSAAATNGSCPHISSIADTNAIMYRIPNSNPQVTLAFNGMRTGWMDPPTLLLTIVENMQPVCRHFGNPFPPSRVFEYALIWVTLQNLYLSCGPLTYNDACTALRGLAEYMVFHNAFHQWRFQIFVNGYALGSGQIDNISPGLPAASAAAFATS